MRSRYTAYSLGNADYLFRTWHPAHRPDDIGLDPGTQWVGLSILAAERGGADDDTGTVEFVARYRDGSGHGTLHEHSEFVRKGGRWFYVQAG